MIRYLPQHVRHCGLTIRVRLDAQVLWRDLEGRLRRLSQRRVEAGVLWSVIYADVRRDGQDVLTLDSVKYMYSRCTLTSGGTDKLVLH